MLGLRRTSAVASDRLEGEPVFPLVLLFGLNAVDELDRAAFGVLSPQIKDHFNTDIATLTGLTGLVGILVVVASIWVGYAADRTSRVRLTLWASGIWALFSLGTGLAGTLVILTVCRIGEGVAKAVNEPTHKSLLADYYPPGARGWAYYAHSAANSVGACLAPLLAGGLAYLWGWRAPFIAFAVPAVLLSLLGAARLREPVRGAQERAAGGASAELVAVEEAPPSFAEAWRELHAITSLRRSLHALPFLGVTVAGFGGLISLLLDERYGVDALDLGLILGLGALLQVAAFEAFGRITARVIVTAPAKVYGLIAWSTPVTALSFVAVGLAPNLTLTIVAVTVLQVSVAPIIAGPPTALSLVMPPRARATGFAVVLLYFVPGFVLYGAVGAIADAHGFTAAFLAMCPCLLIGTGMLVRAGRTVEEDMRAVWAAARTAAEEHRSLEVSGDR